MAREEDEYRRIDSIHAGTPGHWWSAHYHETSNEEVEIDPSRLNLEDVQDFLKLLQALTAGQEAALNFVERIPDWRKTELREMHAELGALLNAFQ